MTDPKQNIAAYNQQAWNSLVKKKDQWTIPVTPEEIVAARQGNWRIVLTPQKHVPNSWFPNLRIGASKVLCLAGSGGQQGPILAAAGAEVTVFDLSPEQLKQDQFVAQRDGLELKTVQGDMRDLSCFDDQSFDLIVHPCSNTFVPDVNPVWCEAARVLKPGGQIMSGFMNPVFFLFDYDEMEQGRLNVAHRIPYSELTSISAEQRQQLIEAGEPLCFGHSLTDQMGGQIAAGLVISGFYEDTWPGYVISDYISTFGATLATKMT